MAQQEKLDGRISISRVVCSEGPSRIEIAVEDCLSTISFLLVEMDLEEFARALTGASIRPCRFRIDPKRVERVGLQHEYKVALVRIPPTLAPYEKFSDPVIAGLLSPFEVDGWIGRAYDLENLSKRNRLDDGESYGVWVSFDRWVAP